MNLKAILRDMGIEYGPDEIHMKHCGAIFGFGFVFVLGLTVGSVFF